MIAWCKHPVYTEFKPPTRRDKTLLSSRIGRCELGIRDIVVIASRKQTIGRNGVLGHQKSTQKTVPKHGCARKASWIIVVPLMTQRGNRSHATFTMHDVASVCNSAFTAHSTVPKPSRFSCISDPITTGRPLNALVDK